MNNEFPHDPYRQLEWWWGEPLSRELAERIADAPARHLREFDALLLEPHGRFFRVASKPVGPLRPILSSSSVHKGHLVVEEHRFSYLAQVAPTLLYAHEVLVENPLPWSRFTSRIEATGVLSILLELKPLYDTGFVSFVEFSGMSLHPAYSHGFMSIGPEAPIEPEEASEIKALMRKVWDGRTSEEVGNLVFSLRSHVGRRFLLTANNPGQFHHMIRNDAEHVLYRLVVLRASLASIDDRGLRLQTLASLDVPSLGSDIAALVRLRQSEETFSEWRHHLGIALGGIGEIEPGASNWVQRANGIIMDELEPMREKLEATCRRSSALAALSKGAKTFALAGIGAGAGYLAGGNLETALVSAAATKATELAGDYVASLREKRTARAILDLMIKLNLD